MSTRISPTLTGQVRDGVRHVCCSACDQTVASGDSHWKDQASVQTTPANQLEGWSASVHPELELRQFACPSCGQLLDSEVALREDPYLYDTVHF